GIYKLSHCHTPVSRRTPVQRACSTQLVRTPPPRQTHLSRRSPAQSILPTRSLQAQKLKSADSACRNKECGTMAGTSGRVASSGQHRVMHHTSGEWSEPKQPSHHSTLPTTP